MLDYKRSNSSLSITCFDEESSNRRLTRLIEIMLHSDGDKRPSVDTVSNAFEDLEELISLRAKYQDLENKYQHLEEQAKEQCEIVEDLMEDNEGNRAYIDRSSTRIHPEEYYVQFLGKFNERIEYWAAKVWDENREQILSDSTYDEIELFLTQAQGLEDVPSRLFQYMNFRINETKSAQIGLIRQIIAIFLFDQVFDRFTFGLSRTRSDYLKWMEEHIFDQGLPYPIVLTI